LNLNDNIVSTTSTTTISNYEVSDDDRQNVNLESNNKSSDDESDKDRDINDQYQDDVDHGDNHHHHNNHGSGVVNDHGDNEVLKEIDNIIAIISLRLKHEHIMLLQELFDVGYDLCIVEVDLIRMYEVLIMMKPWIEIMERYVKDGVIHASMGGVALYYR
jgi:hypothetical protein